MEELIGFGVFGVFILTIYFVPAIVALVRSHRQKGAIIALNVFLGWTLLGWVIALVWAFTNPSGPVAGVSVNVNQGISALSQPEPSPLSQPEPGDIYVGSAQLAPPPMPVMPVAANVVFCTQCGASRSHDKQFCEQCGNDSYR